MDADEAGHRDDCGEVLRAGSGRVPWCAAVVRLTDGGDLAVRPSLLAEPLDRCVDTRLLVVAHQIHAVVALAGAEDADLGDGVAVRDEVLDQEAAEAVSRGQSIDVAVAVVWANLSYDRGGANGEAVARQG